MKYFQIIDTPTKVMSNRYFYTTILCLCLFLLNSGKASGKVALADSLTLVNLYNQTNGASWMHIDGWLISPVSEWHGITLNDEGSRVTEIRLDKNHLTDSLPDLGALSELTYLQLSHNNLTCPFPDVSELPKLEYLHLANNSFSGQIPDLEHLQNLKYLTASNNNLSGELPSFDKNKELLAITFAHNQLSGTIPSLDELGNLLFLDLQYNFLSGSIPAVDSLKNIWGILLNNNYLSGTIPDFSVIEVDKNGLFISVTDNQFTYEGLAESIIGFQGKEDSVTFYYSPQAALKVYDLNDTLLYVDAGDIAVNNTYRWYDKDTVLLKEAVGDSTFSFSRRGYYFCEVDNNLADLRLVSKVKNADCLIGDNCVKPGDTNQDGIVNYMDLLNIGLGYGTVGRERADQSTDYETKFAQNWVEVFPDGVNYKHANTNGDSIIDILDVAVIKQNYQKEIFEDSAFLNNPYGIPLSWQHEDTIIPDLEYTFKINLGSDTLPVSGLYGLGFTISFDVASTDSVQLNDPFVRFNNSWLGQQGDNLITLDTCFSDQKRWEVALTRTDGNAMVGSGEICMLVCVMEVIGVDAKMLRENPINLSLNINNGYMLNAEGEKVSLKGMSSEVLLAAHEPEVPQLPPLENQISMEVYPNPAQNNLFIDYMMPYLPNEMVNGALTIYDLMGRVVQTQSIQDPWNRLELDISDIPNGHYILELKNEDERKVEKIIIYK